MREDVYKEDMISGRIMATSPRMTAAATSRASRTDTFRQDRMHSLQGSDEMQRV